jgi:hypothetical protein
MLRIILTDQWYDISGEFVPTVVTGTGVGREVSPLVAVNQMQIDFQHYLAAVTLCKSLSYFPP